MKHLFFDGVSGTSILTFTRPCISDANITVEGSGIWQFGIKIDDTVTRNFLSIYDKDNPLQITKGNSYEFYTFEPKKEIYANCINEYDSYTKTFDNYVSYFSLLYTGSMSRSSPPMANDEVTMVFDFNTNDLSLYRKGVFHKSYNALSFLNGKNMQFSYWCQNKNTSIHIQFNDGSPEYPIKYPISGIPTLYDHINTIRCYSYKDKNGFIYGYK